MADLEDLESLWPIVPYGTKISGKILTGFSIKSFNPKEELDRIEEDRDG